MQTLSRMAALGVVAVLFTQTAAAAEPARATPSPEQVKFFESKVRPLLSENCYSCHGEKKQKGGLRLDSAEAVAKGGKDGAVVVPGKPAESKLVVAVGYQDEDLQMPPEDRLSAEQVAVLTQWVAMGAPYPTGGAAVASSPRSKKRIITDDDRAFWSYQPPQETAAPDVNDARWSKNVIDRFVFAKLAAEGLAPSTQADRATLARRAYFDLWGLPPTPQQVDEFVNDPSPGAWTNLIDRLLASPRYGERMARHWLDLVRYAESDGYKADGYRPNVWPYRDYVIKSFNDDKPYDRFVREQLAGDEIAPEDPNVVIGTAFLRHGIYEYNQRDVKKHWQTTLDEVTDVTADAFLGLSMGCAKCHDHKFDPILQSDYYRLEAFFAPMLPKQDAVLATPEERAKYDAARKVWEAKTAAIREQLEPIERPYIERAAKASLIKFPQEIQDILNKPEKQRTPYEEQIAQLAARQLYDRTDAGDAKVTGKEKDQHLALVRKLAEFDEFKPKPLQTSLLVGDIGPVAPPTFVPSDASKQPLAPGYPVVLDSQPLTAPEIRGSENDTGRRLALAKWLTQPNHPLTTRVIANRVWQWHFGRGLVGTSSDFGKIGERPSHPELLDYLAVQFVKNGWSFKQMHRLIMTSAAYTQSSGGATPEAARVKDPDDRLLWRFPPQRLEAEEIRDAMLAVSGELKLEGAGGPSADPSAPKRSVYTKVLRNTHDPLLEVFDVPDTFSSAADRNRTTTATQALLMINGDVALKRAEMFAARLRSMNLKTPDETVEAAWKIAYGRTPSGRERDLATAFLSGPTTPAPTVAIADSGPGTADFKPRSIDEKPLVKNMPQLGSQAIYIRNARPDDMLRLAAPANMPTDDFTVEAYVLLDSLYDDASVRVIASQWDGKNDHPGWALGVTSTKSRYEPQNLILQLACDPKREGGGYEVIASDFRIELHKTYYVAVSVKLHDTSEAGVTFYLKDVGDMDAPLKTVSVKHKLTGGYANKSALVIGGRDSKPAQGFDGLIDQVRISRQALAKEDLLFNDGAPARTAVCGHWLFEDQPGIFKDSTGVQPDLTKPAAASAPVGSTTNSALVDFCHVLLNSNRFLYVD